MASIVEMKGPQQMYHLTCRQTTAEDMKGGEGTPEQGQAVKALLQFPQ